MTEIIANPKREQALALVKRVQEFVAARISKHDGIPPFAIALAGRDPRSGEVIDPPVDVFMPPPEGLNFDDSAQRAIYFDMIRAGTLGLDAYAVIFVSEVWMLKVSTHGKSQEEASAEVNSWIGRVHENPARVEQLMVSLETVEGDRMLTMAPILRAEGQPPALGEWAPLEHYPESEGNAVGLLPHAPFVRPDAKA